MNLKIRLVQRFDDEGSIANLGEDLYGYGVSLCLDRTVMTAEIFTETWIDKSVRSVGATQA
jgi:hypothetical protein